MGEILLGGAETEHSLTLGGADWGIKLVQSVSCWELMEHCEFTESTVTILVIVFLVTQSTYLRQCLEGKKDNYPQTETPLDIVRVIEAVFVFPA